MRWRKPAETLRFLRRVVIELRTIALTTTPPGSEELRRIASEIEADANDLERRANAPFPFNTVTHDGQLAMSTPMTRPSLVAIRSYRIYFRDGLNTLSPAREVDLASDEEARQLAETMLSERPECMCAEV